MKHLNILGWDKVTNRANDEIFSQRRFAIYERQNGINWSYIGAKLQWFFNVNKQYNFNTFDPYLEKRITTSLNWVLGTQTHITGTLFIPGVNIDCGPYARNMKGVENIKDSDKIILFIYDHTVTENKIILDISNNIEYRYIQAHYPTNYDDLSAIWDNIVDAGKSAIVDVIDPNVVSRAYCRVKVISILMLTHFNTQTDTVYLTGMIKGRPVSQPVPLNTRKFTDDAELMDAVKRGNAIGKMYLVRHKGCVIDHDRNDLKLRHPSIGREWTGRKLNQPNFDNKIFS